MESEDKNFAVGFLIGAILFGSCFGLTFYIYGVELGHKTGAEEKEQQIKEEKYLQELCKYKAFFDYENNAERCFKIKVFPNEI